MQEQNNTGDGAQAVPEITCETADQKTETVPVTGAGQAEDALTAEELARVAELVTERGMAETTIRGQRVIIVGDLHHSRHLALAAIAQLAAAGQVLVVSDREIPRPGPELLEAQMLKIVEPVVEVDDFQPGKGKRRKPWETPYGPRGGNHKQWKQPQRNIKQMMRRRGGR